MLRPYVSVLSLAALAGSAVAQTVEYRIIERRGQTSVPVTGGVFDTSNTGTHVTTNNILDLAVQARVTGTDPSNNQPYGLGAFGFDVVIQNEADTNGTLKFAQISNTPAPIPAANVGAYPNQGAPYFPGGTPPGTVTYASASSFGTGSLLRQHGLAAQYAYAAGISAALAGNINTSSGSFTNTPNNQEIGLITGRVAGTDLLATPGIDVDPNRHWEDNPGYDPGGDNDPVTNPSRQWINNPDGIPDTYSGPLPPPAGPPNPTATVPAAAYPYFGENGQFFDLFHFQYTINTAATTARTLHFTLQNILAQTFSVFELGNALWGAQNVNFPAGSVVIDSLDIPVGTIPTPGAATLLGLAGWTAGIRRRRNR
jgi:hypothetical protein